jgi:CDP-glucose 4,6-dehydratase
MNLQSAFKDKTVIITGHTGFKGSWLLTWLSSLGAKIIGISIGPTSIINHYDSAHLSNIGFSYLVNITDTNAVKNIFIKHQPDFVFHLAAQSLVRKSYNNPVETWSSNLFGTINILDALRYVNNKCAAVIITSDKCYDNIEWTWGYRENDKLGGPDPYSASKGAAEIAFNSYVKSFFPNDSNIKLATARAGNVIGGGDWSEDRIVPDCITAWSNDTVVDLRNPKATRPWQHVLEPLSGYITLATHLYYDNKFHGESFNFGPTSQQNKSVIELVKSMSKFWEKVRFNDNSANYFGPYESGLLKLNCDKALHLLDWRSILSFEETVEFTIEWYKTYYNKNSNIFDYTLEQIYNYNLIAKKNNIKWSSQE